MNVFTTADSVTKNNGNNTTKFFYKFRVRGMGFSTALMVFLDQLNLLRETMEVKDRESCSKLNVIFVLILHAFIIIILWCDINSFQKDLSLSASLMNTENIFTLLT